jgi:hypothetical protein
MINHEPGVLGERAFAVAAIFRSRKLGRYQGRHFAMLALLGRRIPTGGESIASAKGLAPCWL